MSSCLLERLATRFAPAERADADDWSQISRTLAAEPLLQIMVDAFPGPAMILNEQRQAVLVNQKLVELLGLPASKLLGLRTGEMLDCLHWRDEPWGCGTTSFCRICGNVRAVLNAQRAGVPDVQECRIVRDVHGHSAAFNLRVWATPIRVGDIPLTVFAIQDIADEHRRAMLETSFFHDVLNTAGSLRDILDVWPDLDAEQALPIARDLGRQLVEEIQSARDLAAAESSQLEVALERVDVQGMLAQLSTAYQHEFAAAGVPLISSLPAGENELVSNAVLLRRVLGNLIRNAVEASIPGQSVTISFENSDRPIFSVHNESVMPEEVSLQIFQRYFTTKKGSGRGIGTYSVKLFTERYLGGSVQFASPAPEGGTTFVLELPVKHL